MTRMQNVQEGLHADIAALDSRFDDLPTSEQHQDLVERQQKLQNDFDTFNTTFSGFTNHFYSVYQLQCLLLTFIDTSHFILHLHLHLHRQ
jgi:hypothetical protein